MRLTWRRAFVALVAVVVIGYAAAIARLMSQETELIFRTAGARSDFRPSMPYQQVEVPRTDGARQFAWIMPRDESDVWVLFLHGNASTIGSRMNVKHYGRLHELGVNILAPEYRGYNGLTAVPSEASVGADARAAYEYLRQQRHVSADRLAIYGWSLGAAVAVDLASQVDARLVILEGAPASIVDIGQQRYPLFPVRMIIRNPFHAIQKVARIRSPLLFLHSPEDTVVPYGEGRRLFDAAPSPKRFVDVRGGHVECSEVDPQVFYGAVKAALALSSSTSVSSR
jgi:fermentation-respiration switch protein FrsA (DUF1100 family)